MSDHSDVFIKGRPLQDWVLDLTSPDLSVREAAGEVLRATRVGVLDENPSAIATRSNREVTVLTPEAIAAAWREMIGRVFLVPGFPGGATAVYLARRLMSIHAALRARTARGGEPDFENDESMSAAAMAAAWVLECVGPGGSDVVPTLAEMLHADGGSQAYLAADALAGIGPTAKAAVPALIEAIRIQGANEWPNRKGRALVAIAGDDPEVVRTLTGLLTAPQASAREGACAALYEFGPRAEDAVQALVTATRHANPETRSLAALALGRVGAGRSDVVDALLPLTRDEAWWVRGHAVGAMGELKLRLPELIPTFTTALDDDGGNGDWSVREQALSALGHAGPYAAPVLPLLLAKIQDDDGDIDLDVVRTLGTIGPTAREALSVLTALQKEREEDDEGEIAEAIRRINGEQVPAGGYGLARDE